MKGKQSIGQSILFAGAGRHGPVYCFDDPNLDRFRRSGQRSGGGKRQQYQDRYRNDWVISLATSHENPGSYGYYSNNLSSNECSQLDSDHPLCAIFNQYFITITIQHTHFLRRALIKFIANPDSHCPGASFYSSRYSWPPKYKSTAIIALLWNST